jgi:hypothetical protein
MTHHSLGTVGDLLYHMLLLLVCVILPEAVTATDNFLPGASVLPALLQLAALPRRVIVDWLFLISLHNYFLASVSETVFFFII